MASVKFSSETPSGWQQQNLPSALNIKANQEYVVSVNTGGSFYVATNNGFASVLVNGHLRSASGGNGVFGPGGPQAHLGLE